MPRSSFTVLLAVALLVAVLVPGAPVLAGAVVAAALAHRLVARHHLLHLSPARAVFPPADAG